MQCKKNKSFLPDLLLEPAQVPADVQQHLKECSQCENELNQLRATVELLDAWDAPEPSPYFDTRLAVRLREAKESAAPGFLERMRMRLLFGRDLHLRPVAVAVFALLLAIGGGSYLGVVNLNHAAPQKQQAVSATVNDLELLDSNAQTLQQLAALDDTSAGGNSISN
ncbi:MAG: hypothetical protein ABI076_10795 [Acidobacteriaceae bacterium]